MQSREAIQWIEKNELTENSEVFTNILKGCLGVKKDEYVLIIGDTGSIPAKLASGYYNAGKELGLNVHIILQEPKYKGDKASREVIDALYDLKPGSVVILALSNRIGSIKEVSNSFRNYIRENKHRFVSATNLGQLKDEDYGVVINSMNIDYEKLQEKGKKLKQVLDEANFVHITTDAGTDLRIGIENCTAVVNTGDYKLPGTGGNVPSGEVYIPPKWKDVNGVVVIDGSSAYRFGTQLIEEPIIVTIKKGEIVDIKGGKEANNLKESLDWACKRAKNPWGIKRVGELGIGINPNAKIIGATIIDEKTVGTAHIAFGSNYWFGGTILAIVHFDQIFKNPKILIDGVELKI